MSLSLSVYLSFCLWISSSLYLMPYPFPYPLSRFTYSFIPSPISHFWMGAKRGVPFLTDIFEYLILRVLSDLLSCGSLWPPPLAPTPCEGLFLFNYLRILLLFIQTLNWRTGFIFSILTIEKIYLSLSTDRISKEESCWFCEEKFVRIYVFWFTGLYDI